MNTKEDDARDPRTVAIQRTMIQCTGLKLLNWQELRFACSGCLDRTLLEDY